MIMNTNVNYTDANFCNNLVDNSQIEKACFIRDLALITDGSFKL
jgi:hypothetical protein